MIEHFDLKRIFKTALAHGGEFAELFEEKSHQTTIHREMKHLEKVHQGIDAGIGLRVIVKGKTFYGFTNTLEEKALLKLAAHLASSIRAGKWNENLSIAAASPNWEKSVLEDPMGVSLERKVQMVHLGDEAAWEFGSEICQVGTSYRDKIREIVVVNSQGRISQERQIYSVFFVNSIARKGEVLQTGYEPVGGTMGFELFNQFSPELIGRTASDRAVKMIHAPKAPKGKMMVVIGSEAGGTMVHEAVGHGLEADLAKEGLSVFQNRVGQTVANPLITVVDDPTLNGKRGSYLFDDEGTPGQKNVLIEKGVLKTYMYDALYSMKENRFSTGNGRRESYQHRPIVRMTNTYIEPGNHSPEEIIKSVPKGLFVKKMGGGQVNTVNGEFVFECTEAYRIENGKIGEPVRGATLVGNGMEVLKKVDQVGNDLGFGLGTCGKCGQGVPVGDGQPTLRVPELTVGGTV